MILILARYVAGGWVMELPADPGLSLIAYSAEPASPDDDALRLLASWAATTDAGPVGGRR